jgi:hypothetical protein
VLGGAASASAVLFRGGTQGRLEQATPVGSPQPATIALAVVEAGVLGPR